MKILTMSKKAQREKICREEECKEQWEQLPNSVKDVCTKFVYCPFCANEMIVRCSACNEFIHEISFGYCPWCGIEFENNSNI